MRYFEVRKGYEYRRSIVVEVLQKCNSRLDKRPLLKTNFSRSFSNLTNCGFQFSTKASSYLLNEVDPFITPKGESESITISMLNKAKLIHYIADLARLVSALKSILSNNSNFIKSASNPILNGLKKISQLLLSGKFKFNKRVRVSEASGNKGEIPLTKVLLCDKIVHKSISEALYDIYEPLFLNCSHGYRRNKSTRTALKLIDETVNGTKWIITARIKSCVENIHHATLLDLLKSRITCVKTLALIKKSLRINPTNATNINVGMSPDSVLSPILSLIYLHEFDLFVNSIITEHSKGRNVSQNLIHEQFQAKSIIALKDNNINEIIRLKKLMQYRSKDGLDSGYIKIGYVRYADSFLISIRGSFFLAKKVLNCIRIFLKDSLHLDLNINKTNISSFQKPICFLGVMISSGYFYLKSAKSLIKSQNKGIKVRLIPYVRFHAPIRILNEKLIIKKFFK
jgi:retron-type reverse transcriptase